MQTVVRQMLGAGDVQPVQLALLTNSRLVKVNDLAGQNRLANLLFGRFQIAITVGVPVAKCALADCV